MEKKKILSNETKEKLKKGAIIILPVVFALVAAISMAVLVGSMNKAKDDQNPDNTEADASGSDVQVMVPGENDADESYSKGLEYSSNGDGTCVVTGRGSCRDRIVRISEQSPSGDRVVEIGSKAFSGESGISEVRLPTGIVRIGSEAFKGSGITVMNIPSSVVSIGDGAFARCTSLMAISVDGASPMFTSASGVLFDREMTNLICYPSGKEDSTYVIPKSVTKISYMAFSSCNNLTKIKYSGTEKQWRNVYVCAGNDTLDRVALTFAPPEK